MNIKTPLIIFSTVFGAFLLGFYLNNLTYSQAQLNKQCSDSARDYFIKMKPPVPANINFSYSITQSLFNKSLNTCVLAVSDGNSIALPDGPTHDLIYDVYKNKELAFHEIDESLDSSTFFCKTWIGNGPWINDTCQNANKQFKNYENSIGL